MSRLADCASPYDRIVNADLAGRRIEINDMTLEGDCEEMAGIRLARDDKIRIAEALAELGVHRISVLGNSPTPTPDEIDDVREIARRNFMPPLCAFVKSPFEIGVAADLGLWGVVILISVNERFFGDGQSGDSVIESAQNLAAQAQEKGLHVAMMAMDSTRAGPDYLRRFVAETETHWDEFVVCDSIGVASPWGFEHLVATVRGWTDKPLQVHCHNNTSMAVANAMAAVRGGASVIHATVNGLGEFAGQVPVEELAVSLGIHFGIDCGLDLARLTDLSRLVAEAASVPLPVNKPVTGPAAFAIPETEEIQEAFFGPAREGRLDEVLTFPPGLVGNAAQMSIGRKCSTWTVAYGLMCMDLEADQSTLETIAGDVRAHAAEQSGYYLMSQDEFAELVRRGGYPVMPASA
jgi:2-isopropylmalate synthase/methanogen homocitrate synthase